MEIQNSGADAALTAPAPTRTEVPATLGGQEQRSGAKRRGPTVPATWDASAALRAAACANLNRTEALVHLHLCSRANYASGVCWPSVREICQNTGVHERNARKAIRGLQDKRLIHTELLRHGDPHPNGKGKVTTTRALVFHVLNGPPAKDRKGPPRPAHLRVIEGGDPGCGARYTRAVEPGTYRAVEPGTYRAVGPGTPGLWGPDTSLLNKSRNEILTERDFLGTGTEGSAETVPRGLRAPAHEPTALRASHPAGSPEGMAEPGDTPDSSACQRRPRGSEDTSPTPSGEAARADGGAREATGTDEAGANIPAPAKTQTQRSRARESNTRAARAVLAYWAKRFRVQCVPLHTTARLDVVRTWLRAGLRPDDLGAAVHAASANPWYRQGERSRISFVLRTEEVIRDLAQAGRDAGFRALPRPPSPGPGAKTSPSDSRAGSGAAIGRELSITPVNESLQYLEKLTSQLGKTPRKELDQ